MFVYNDIIRLEVGYIWLKVRITNLFWHVLEEREKGIQIRDIFRVCEFFGRYMRYA